MEVVTCFECGTDVGQPFVHGAVAGAYPLVAPVCGQPVFGYLVHAFGPDLYFDPFVLRAEHRDVQAFVSVALRDTQPVAEALWVGLVAVCDEAVCLPALLFFFLAGGVDDDAYGEEVIDAFEGAVLLLHLLPDGMDAFSPAFDVKTQSGVCEHVLYWGYEPFNVGVARCFGGVELVLDHVVRIVFKIFQGQVFKFAFELVEAQFVCQGSVKVGCLYGGAADGFLVGIVLDVAHEVDAVGNDEQYDAHVLGERHKQVAEVVTLDAGSLGVELADAAEAMKHGRYTLAECLSDGSEVGVGGEAGLDKACGQGVAPHPDLGGGQNGCLQRCDDGVESERVARQCAVPGRLLDAVAQQAVVLTGEEVGIGLTQCAEKGEQFGVFFGGEEWFFSSHRPNVLDKSTFFR